MATMVHFQFLNDNYLIYINFVLGIREGQLKEFVQYPCTTYLWQSITGRDFIRCTKWDIVESYTTYGQKINVKNVFYEIWKL